MQKGFNFTIEVPKELIGKNFEVFNDGMLKKSKNLLETSRGRVDWKIFEHQYSIGRRSAFKQTIFMAINKDKILPKFCFGKGIISHRMWEDEYKDIIFDNYPIFSKTYILRGEDEEHVRKLFSPELVSSFEASLPEEIIEAERDTIILYRIGSRIKPKDIEQEFEKVRSIAEMFIL
jgi:hypothetical protein